jgi:hypothetical protein
MVTVVWSTAGSVQQAQVGAANIVETLSGMTDAWGWIGGLSGVLHILANIPNPFGTNGISNLGVNSISLPATCYIIISSGIIPYRDDATSDAFS